MYAGKAVHGGGGPESVGYWGYVIGNPGKELKG